MRVYGLTGNIGAGKSTVARLLRDRGVPVVDADLVARQLVEPGQPALDEVVARFPGVLAGDGALDRRALAARVFNDASERAALNAILHPRIALEVGAQLAKLADGGAPFAVYEAALIVENGMHAMLDGLVVVTAPEDEQVRRVVLRDRLAEGETRARIAAQLPAAQKVAVADFVLRNEGDPAALVPQVEALLAALRAGFSKQQGAAP